MFSTLVTVALFAAASIRGVAADDFQIYTPASGSVTQCQDMTISWSGGKAPFNVIIVPAEDPCADAVQDLGDTDQWTTTFTPKLTAGQAYVMSLMDTTGAEAWSDKFTPAAGDASCLPAGLAAVVTPPSSSSAAPSTSSAANVTGTTLTISSTPVPSNPASGSSGSYGGQSGQGSSPAVGPVGAVGSEPFSGSSNGASRQAAPVMLLGAFAAIAAFIL